MPVFGRRDRIEGTPPEAGQEYRDLLQGEICADCGLARDVPPAPVSVNDDGSVGIFMIPPGAGPGRFFWVGNGDRAFFPTFREIFECAVEPQRRRNYAVGQVTGDLARVPAHPLPQSRLPARDRRIGTAIPPDPLEQQLARQSHPGLLPSP
ncbi:hypothetical protein ACFVUY_40375 [Kitasatospora sp. NPDC058063]|uniref:hypothetical protein n=1 Tax=unclassified Kitasatospora TaxID=2633591 RepID=UPI0036DEC646